MRRRASSLIAWMALAVATGCGGGGGAATTPAAPAPLAAPGTWVVLGSSTAAGVGASAGQGWAHLLGTQVQHRQVTVQNLARSGALSYETLPTDSMPPVGRPSPDPAINIDRALSYAPKLLLLSFPTNDTAAGHAGAETLQNLRTLRERALASGSAVMLLSTQPRDAFSDAQRAQLAEIDREAAIRFGACFVALREALSDATGRIAAAYSAGDGIHLNDAGHRLVLDRVTAQLDTGRCVRLASN